MQFNVIEKYNFFNLHIILKEVDMKYVLSKLIFVIFVFLPLFSCHQGSVLNEQVGINANNITYI